MKNIFPFCCIIFICIEAKGQITDIKTQLLRHSGTPEEIAPGKKKMTTNSVVNERVFDNKDLGLVRAGNAQKKYTRQDYSKQKKTKGVEMMLPLTGIPEEYPNTNKTRKPQTKRSYSNLSPSEKNDSKLHPLSGYINKSSNPTIKQHKYSGHSQPKNKLLGDTIKMRTSQHIHGNPYSWYHEKNHLKNGTQFEKLDSIVTFDNEVYHEKKGLGNTGKCYFEYNVDGNVVKELDLRLNPTKTLIESNKWESTYNAAGNQISYAAYYWDTYDSLWIGDGTKWVKTFDALGNPAGEISYIWDFDLRQWVNYSKEESIYNSDSLLIMDAFYTWDPNSANWIGEWKYEYNWDANKNRISWISYAWDIESGNWVYPIKEERSYDLNGNVVESVLYNWDGSVWYPGDYKYVYSFDVNNRQLSRLIYKWNSGSSSWINYRKYEYAYDLNGLQTLNAQYEWDVTGARWIGYSKTVHSYTTNREELLYEYYNAWDTTGNQWKGRNKYEYEYDAEEKLILYKQFSWDNLQKNWLWWRKSTFTYDANKLRLSVSRFDWISNSWVQVIKGDYSYTTSGLIESITEYSWDNNKSQWINLNRRQWGYDQNNFEKEFTYFNWDNTLNEWIGSYKYEYAWDKDTNQILYTYYGYFDYVQQKWIGNYKYEYNFDSQHREISYAYYGWDSELQQWVGNYKYDYAYGVDSESITLMNYNWDSYSNSWYPESDHKEYYEYNKDGKIVFSGRYVWDYYSQRWNPYGVYSYTYDTNGFTSTILVYDWNHAESEIIAIQKTVYTRNTNGKLIEHLIYRINDIETEFIPYKKTNYTRDSKYNIQKWEDFAWDTKAGKWYKTYEQTYQYDASGNNISQFGYLWDAQKNAGILDDKNEMTYDQKGNNLLWVYFDWDEFNKKWIEVNKTQNSYDANGHQTLKLNFNQQTTGKYEFSTTWKRIFEYGPAGEINRVLEEKPDDYENKYMEEYTYNAAGKITQYSSFDWDYDINTWEKDESESYFYDGGGRLIRIEETESSEFYDSHKWKTEISYHTNGKMGSYIDYYWSFDSSSWFPEYKHERSYDVIGNCTLNISYNWNSETSSWENNWKEEFFYDASGNRLSETRSEWLEGSWQKYNRNEYNYNASKKIASIVDLNWNNQTSQWNNIWKEEYTYDNQANLVKEIESYWNGFSWDTTELFQFKHDLTKSRDQLYISWIYLEDFEESYYNEIWVGELKDDLFYDVERNIYKPANKLTELTTNEKDYTTMIFETTRIEKLYYSDVSMNSRKLTGVIRKPNQLPITAGYVKLFKEETTGSFNPIDSVHVQPDGSYLFSEVEYGRYLILATADTTQLKRSVPTYYGNTGIWSEALNIQVNDTSVLDTLNIRIIVHPTLNGKATLSGQVVENGKKSGGIEKSSEAIQGRPVKGASIVLVGRNKAGGEILAKTLTDADGKFEFHNVPAGTFDILVDIPGVEVVSFHTVTVKENQTVIENLNYAVGQQGIIIDEIDETHSNVLKIYPNPGKDVFFLDVSEWEGRTVRVTDMQGKLRLQIRLSGPHTELHHSLAPGIYILSIDNTSIVQHRKLIIR